MQFVSGRKNNSRGSRLLHYNLIIIVVVDAVFFFSIVFIFHIFERQNLKLGLSAPRRIVLAILLLFNRIARRMNIKNVIYHMTSFCLRKKHCLISIFVEKIPISNQGKNTEIDFCLIPRFFNSIKIEESQFYLKAVNHNDSVAEKLQE